MRSVPIRIRVAGAFALAMAVVLAATSWFVYSSLSSHLALALDHDLRLRADDLSALVRQPGSSLAETSNPGFIEHGEAYAQLLAPDGTVLDATRPLGHASIVSPAELQNATQETVFVDRPRVPGLDEPSRLLATPIERGGQALVLVVGTTSQDRAETLSSLRDELLIAVPIALVLATIAGYLLAGFSLRPVEAMRRRAAAISAETPGERLPVPTTGDEVELLGQTLNSMLARLEAALQRERDFVADAGHELRTPLALLRTELELALRHCGTAEELRAAVRSSSEEVDRLVQLAEDLLLIARTDKGDLPLRLERIEVETLLAFVATRFEWRAAEAGREIVCIAPRGTSVVGDRLRLEQALGNLVDNALRYASGTIRLQALPGPDETLELHVRDEGPGLPTEFLPHAFERFTRPDADRAGPGTGLGLSIVQTIASAHGGGAAAVNRVPAGADIWITLPLHVAVDAPCAPGLRQRMAEFESARRLRSSKGSSEREWPALSRPSTVILPEGQAAGSRRAHGGAWQMAERKPAKKVTQESVKRTTFSDEERVAMKERAEELKAEARAGKADGESAVLAKIAEMQGRDRAMAKRLHAIIKASAPALSPKTWYGMPAYAKDGKVVCYFQSAQKFKSRYATFGFSDEANLDEGAMWPTSFALTELTAADEARIVALVKKAVS